MTPAFLAALLAARTNPEMRKELHETLLRAQKAMKAKKPEILDKLVKLGLITEKEKPKYSADYLVEYLNIASHMEEFTDQKIPAMVTTVEILLAQREELQNKFKVKIFSPDEALNHMQKEAANETSYIG
jgi:polyhydroxyalkanoate synthesis regulator phasin